MATIAIDFDDTFTTDETLWAGFIHSAKSRGHEILCVTSRRDSEDSLKEINRRFEFHSIQIRVIFSNRKSKVDTMKDKGIRVDIWIDDLPYGLIHDLKN